MNQPQYRLAWPPITKPMIGLFVAFFVLWLGALQGAPLHEVTRDYLTLTADGITERYAVWSLGTYAIFHRDFFGILFAVIAVWLFGGELAERWSAKKFWGVQVVAAFVGGLFCLPFVLLFDASIAVQGYHASSMALVFSYCWLRWRTPQHFFFFEMTGRTMLLLFLGLGALVSVMGHWPTIVLDLAGVVVGFVASQGKLNLRELRTRFRMWQARRRLKVVRSPEDDGPRRKNADGMYIN